MALWSTPFLPNPQTGLSVARQSALRMSEVVAVKRDPVGNVSILDQSRLPAEEKWLSLSTAEDVPLANRASPTIFDLSGEGFPDPTPGSYADRGAG